MRAFEIHPGARVEILEAGDFYRGKDERARVRFAAALDRAMERLQEIPEAQRFLRDAGPDVTVRAITVKTFPYRVVFFVTPTLVKVVGVEHKARGTETWAGRVPS